MNIHLDQDELDDSTADRKLLDASGISLLVFYSATCGVCQQARAQLPQFDLPVARLVWIDAGRNGGLVQRYEVYHLPAIHVVRDGVYYGPLSAQLADWDLRQQIAHALDNYPAELP